MRRYALYRVPVLVEDGLHTIPFLLSTGRRRSGGGKSAPELLRPPGITRRDAGPSVQTRRVHLAPLPARSRWRRLSNYSVSKNYIRLLLFFHGKVINRSDSRLAREVAVATERGGERPSAERVCTAPTSPHLPVETELEG